MTVLSEKSIFSWRDNLLWLIEIKILGLMKGYILSSKKIKNILINSKNLWKLIILDFKQLFYEEIKEILLI